MSVDIPEPDLSGNTRVQVGVVQNLPDGPVSNVPTDVLTGIIEVHEIPINKQLANQVLRHSVQRLETDNIELKEKLAAMEAKVESKSEEITSLKVDNARMVTELDNKGLSKMAIAFAGGILALGVHAFKNDDITLAIPLFTFALLLNLAGFFPELFKARKTK